MTSQRRRTRVGREPEYINDTGGAIRITYDEPPEPRTARAGAKARLLRPGLFVVLGVPLGVAAVTALAGLPGPAATRLTREAPLAAAASPAALEQPSGRAVHSSSSGTPDVPATDLRFLDADDAGRLAYQSGDYEDALARFTAAIERNPTDAESMSNAAQVLVRLGRAPEALPLLRRAVELNGARWAYRFNLARALDQVGETGQAIEQYEAASALFPDDYATLFNLAQAYHKQGADAAAVERYQRAIALNPAEPTYHFALAVSLETQGKNAEASEAYARFLELAPESPDAARVRERIGQLQSNSAPAPADGARPGDVNSPIK